MKQIYVSVGHPHSKIPFVNRTVVNVEEGSERTTAKILRKDVANNPGHFGFPREFNGYKPSELYWAIFEGFSEDNPVLFSDNYFWGVNGKRLRHEETPRIGETWYDNGYIDRKGGKHIPPEYPENRAEYLRGALDYEKSLDKITEVFDILVVKQN